MFNQFFSSLNEHIPPREQNKYYSGDWDWDKGKKIYG